MTTTTNPLVRERARGAAHGRWLMLIVLLAGQSMALLDVMIVNVAMPTIGRGPGRLRQAAHAPQLAQASSSWTARRDGNHSNATSRWS